jgi:hypothetical protein
MQAWTGFILLFKQSHTLPVLHFNRCLTAENSEITAHFNCNFDTDNQIYVSRLSERNVFRSVAIFLFICLKHSYNKTLIH